MVGNTLHNTNLSASVFINTQDTYQHTSEIETPTVIRPYVALLTIHLQVLILICFTSINYIMYVS